MWWGGLEKPEVYSDASFCNLRDGMSSTQDQVILLRGHKQCCVLEWSSVKIKRKVSSILEAEALSLKRILDNAITLVHCCQNLFFETSKKTN